MNSTRQIQIYPDPDQDDSFMRHNSRPQLQPSAMPLQPTRNTVMNSSNVVLNPPESTSFPQSPSKGQNGFSPRRSIYGNGLSFVPIPPPTAQTMFSDSPVKKPPVPACRPLNQPMLQQPLFTTFHSAPPPSHQNDSFEKENYVAPSSYSENFADFPDPTYHCKLSTKRGLMNAAPIMERPFKKTRHDDSPNQLPDPEDMPVVEDDGGKPAYSYAHLIGMAILRSPNRRLTLAQIYKWISDTFKFYQSHESGWQNSIRHNLSLNKAFHKVERPKDDPGKGNYWVIESGMEMQFVKERPQRHKALGISLSQNIIAEDPMRNYQGTLKPNSWSAPPPPPPADPIIPPLPELDSDGTIDASDPALNDDANDDINQPSSQLLQSSPPQAINSSPPVVPDQEAGTPEVSHFIRPSSAQMQTRKQKMDMDDSGYFSSLESSAFRPNKANDLLASEADNEKPRKKKRGRAEEEIARIRSSSHDISPDHLRLKAQTDDILTSSPLRPNNAMLPPLTPTPGMVFKKPMRPPPSVSPNTNLRQHRQKVQELVNSPVKSLGLYGEDVGYSPAFKIHESASHDNFESHFDIFADTNLTTTPGFVSPFKKSVKRPALNRTNTSTGALTDITPFSSRFNTSNPRTSRPSKLSGYVAATGSPLKLTSTVAATGSPLKVSDAVHFMAPQDDLFDFGSFADENIDAADGFDILQGFQKIGSGDHLNNMTPSGKKPRPAFGRSLTSRF